MVPKPGSRRLAGYSPGTPKQSYPENGNTGVNCSPFVVATLYVKQSSFDTNQATNIHTRPIGTQLNLNSLVIRV